MDQFTDIRERLARIEERSKDITEIKKSLTRVEEQLISLRIRVAVISGGISLFISAATYLIK